ncbi:septum site-determining protein MinC [Pandoraea nosoerga]|uniref:Probable septum site-determining protein MinC n=1 Tax=Pandoraea nosoerga TaxID=2508296 RepID=A0A5E4SDF4_9BURK|nr:septum site-determining protein MinC [Pandoraea nosoerga]MBN4666988.1 septum site-determining protein MinC [Pandoraea nosoerga]MBN4674797.1 septum site-determining protein MinC [Pandoraea nosoerga]MBN4681775.1 septum site-determining protein MinC [Pandoraea nosoerga]MBN4744092.1 septum site-determining protein MinC [Pandoraea nosoerga]VVD73133.1 septum site-determining protein MinC [Pandoraea nosoerga]
MPQKKTPYFELRSGAVDTLHFVVKTPELDTLRTELAQRFEATPEFFAGDTVAIDVRRLAGNERVAVPALAEMLTEFRMKPIGVVANTEQADWAVVEGLPRLDSHERRISRTPRDAGGAGDDEGAPAGQSAGATAAAAAVAGGPAPAEASAIASTIIDKPLRSGQQVYAKGDLIILDLVSYGAEVIAEGNIHIYAPLRGRALAGVKGKLDARIFCTCLEPELISIAGIYRTGEHALPPEVQGRSVQVRLVDDKLIFEPLGLK